MSAQLAKLREIFAGRLTIDHELGRGGMATVYLAHDLRHGRAVALKVLRPDLLTALGPERFLREIAVTARLDHPHILPLLDSGEIHGVLYYLMPYVEGESLRDRLSRERQLPLADALQIAREVADALSYAHNHGVIHRDIKPENVLLAAGHARVADFGIARAIRAAGTELTEAGLAIGTPAYMSPEQAAGDRALDARRTGAFSNSRADSSWFRADRRRGAPGTGAGTPFGLLVAELTLALRPEDEAWALLQSKSHRGTPNGVIWMLYRRRKAQGARDRA